MVASTTHISFPHRRPRWACLALLGALAVTGHAADDAGHRIYMKQCASCHGDQGQGVREEYADPLVGERSLASLIRYIDKRMPEEDPKLCVGEDARLVGEYIYHAFYSSEAQVRRNPPRVELTRLTVGQYRNAIADLLGSFHGVAKPEAQRGLKAEYFNDGRGFNGDKRVIERIEPIVEVAFEGQPPSPEIRKDQDKDAKERDTEEYAVRWSGSVLAPEDGVYDFVVYSPNGARLWVNDRDRPLINNWVRSGDDPRQVASLRLLAGRTYHLKLEVAKQRSESQLYAALNWKPPHHVEQRIPERLLSPGGGSQWLVPQTPFPPDDNSLGYERGSSLSKAWDEATTQAAFEVADHIDQRLQRFTGAKVDDGDAKTKLIAFARRFAERAFRRPLDDELARFFVDQHFEGGLGLQEALRKSVVLVLKSPRFLFNGLAAGPQDAYAVAERLALGLWDSLPDGKLLEAAKHGRLAKREDLEKEVARMIDDPRTRAKVLGFYHHWLKLEELRGLSKEAGRFPGFDERLVSDLRTSLDLFLDEVTWSEASDFRRLVRADTLHVNGRLARFYGLADAPAGDDAPFVRVTAAGQPHAGVVTHPLLMAGFSYSATTSPIHRGVFVSRALLGRRLRSPPDSITPESPELHPDLTTRQRIGKQTAPDLCMSCHDMINPLGFTMEHFDAVGRFRKDEHGRPLDTSGSYRGPDGDVVAFKDARDLGAFLAESHEAQGAFVERLFKELVKQPLLAYGPDEKERLTRYFSDNGFSIRKLLTEIIISSATATLVDGAAPIQASKP